MFWRLYVNNRDGASLILKQAGSRPREYKISKGSVHLIPPWLMFDLKNTADVQHLYMHFDILGLPGTLIREMFNQPVGFKIERDSKPLVDSLLRCCDRSPANAPAGPGDIYAHCQAKALVYLSLGQLFAQLSEPKQQRCGRFLDAQNEMKPVLAYIDQNLGNQLSNDSLAAICHLSPDHFIRKFRKSVGQTPAQYIIERRVTRAAEQLLFTCGSIEQVADDLGFPDRHYFSRVFKTRMGVAPATYRKRSSI